MRMSRRWDCKKKDCRFRSCVGVGMYIHWTCSIHVYLSRRAVLQASRQAGWLGWVAGWVGGGYLDKL